MGQPKSRDGLRQVPLIPEAVTILREHQAEQAERALKLGPHWVGRGNVFDQGHGAPLPAALLGRALTALCGAAGVTPIKPHDLRHTVGTILAAGDVNPKTVSRLLGHSNVAITLNTYTHPDAPSLRRGVERMRPAPVKALPDAV